MSQTYYRNAVLFTNLLFYLGVWIKDGGTVIATAKIII